MNEVVDNSQRKSPYQGLTPYDEADAPFFFGRERETKLITASLFASPLTLLYGASGVGKSSILRAGVLKGLRERKDVLAIVFARWQADPLAQLRTAIAQATLPFIGKKRLGVKQTAQKKAIQLLARAPSAKMRIGTRNRRNDLALNELVSSCSRLAKRRLMIILDQFEEYSLYHPNTDALDEELPAAIAISDLSASFLLSLREDAVAQLDRFEGRIPALFNNFRRIEHLDRAAAKRAITEPLKRYNELRERQSAPISIEPALVEEVLNQVRTGQLVVSTTAGTGAVTPTSINEDRQGRIETPYLQLVMTRLWTQERDLGSSLLRTATLSQLGGAQRIVLTHLDGVMSNFSDQEKDLAAKVFNQLVTPSGTKIAHLLRDLSDYAGVSSDELKPLLEKLSRGSDRILRPVASLPEFPDEPRYEIFHDRLGAAILDWRSRYLHEQELLKSKLQEAEQRSFSRSYVERLMDKLAPREQNLTAKMIPYLITPSGVKITQRLVDLSSYLEVTSSELSQILAKLCIEDGIFTRIDSKERERYEIRHDALIPAVLNWRAGYLKSKELEKITEPPGGWESLGGGGGVPVPPSQFLARPAPPSIYSAIKTSFQQGRVAVFVGPGASGSGRNPNQHWRDGAPFPPTGYELTRYLASLVEYPYEVGAELADLDSVASYVEAYAGRSFLNEHLQRVLANTEFEIPLIYKYLAKVAQKRPLLIVSSNYDDLLEQSMQQAAVPFDVVINRGGSDFRTEVAWQRHGQKSPEIVSPRKLDEMSLTDCSVIYKYSGSIDRDRRHRENSTFLVTDSDYLASLLIGEQAIPSIFRHQLSRNSLLLLGWSLRSWHNRGFFQQVAPRFTSRPNWSFLFRPSLVEQAFCERSKIDLFDEDLNNFVDRMESADVQPK